MTLEKAGHDVLEAENGERAIEAINSNENPFRGASDSSNEYT